MDKVTSIATAVFLTFLMTSCGEDSGPAGQVGKKVDEAVDNVATRAENEGPAEKAGDRVDKALEQAADGLQKAGQTVGEAIQDTGEQVKEKSGG